MWQLIRRERNRSGGQGASRSGVVLAATLLVLVIGVGGLPVVAKASLDAARQEDPVTVDGVAEEWRGEMTYLDGPDMHVGARHDGTYLYLCFSTVDPGVGRMAMGRGLVLRLDPKGGDPFKIQFPVGVIGPGGPMPDPRSHDRERMQRQFEEGLDTFVLFAPRLDERQYVPVDNDFGISMSATVEEGRFVYELKVPLVKSEFHPYAVEAIPGSTIALRLDTPEIEFDAARQPRGGMGPGGGRGGRGPGGARGGMGGRPPAGGMGGGPGGGMRGGPRGGQRPDPLHLRAKIRLVDHDQDDRQD